jgi:hypothetical protein
MTSVRNEIAGGRIGSLARTSSSCSPASSIGGSKFAAALNIGLAVARCITRGGCWTNLAGLRIIVVEDRPTIATMPGTW